MWTVVMHRDVKKALRKVPSPVRRAFAVWIGVLQTEGPNGLRAARGFKDEALKGRWAGHRSSRPNTQYRVIYRVNADVIEMLALDVTAHDFRRKQLVAQRQHAERSEFVSADAGVLLTPGETIKTLREMNELTQKDLAEETGIPQTMISAIESGRTKLGVERAKVFARAFNVHPAVVLFSDWTRNAA